MDCTRLAARLLEPVPANRSFGLRVLRADASGAEVLLEEGAPFANVIGALHSSGLIALIDAAGLAAMIGSCHAEAEFDGLTPLGTTASVQFLAPARGPLIGRCQLEPFESCVLRDLLEGRTRKEELETSVEVVDRDGLVVCRGRFAWKLRRAHAPSGAPREPNGVPPGLRATL
jgi:acyl-coenzyme A thioesterase PaaI-like protein